MMTPDDVQTANRLLTNLRDHESRLQALKEFKVKRVFVGRIGESLIELGGNGTGTISSIGITPDLEEHMTLALQKYFIDRTLLCSKQLRDMGVNLD